MTKFEFTVSKEDLGLKLKSLLKNKYGFSTRLLTKLKGNGGVFLNGEPAKMYAMPEIGQVVSVELPQEKSEFTPEDIPIAVVYEDEDILVINKQQGYVVHPTKGHPNHTIANGLMKYILDNDLHFKIRFVNRLDMDTTGLLIIAKNSHSQNDFSKQMALNKVAKKYVALVKGCIESDEGTIDLPIGKALEDRVDRMVREDGLQSVTHYKVLERYTKKPCTLVELLLETGRTHQIRVHMSHIGHPVVGDYLYGGDDPLLIERQALHAKYLKFFHPVTGKVMELEAPMPLDMQELIKKIK